MSYSTDPALFLYTSLTSGSSHIVTATSRLETILRANKIPFKALDVATDEKARMLWGRRAGKDETGRVRKLPGLVQEGLVLGDLVEVEDWNEYGELKLNVKIVPVDGPGAVKDVKPPTSTAQSAASEKQPSTTNNPAIPTETDQTQKENKKPVGDAATPFTAAMKQAGQEAAQKAHDNMNISKSEGKIPVAQGATGPKHIDVSASSGTLHIEEAVLGMEKMSLQSPNSTAWRPMAFPSLLIHKGPSVEVVSKECIQKIEDEQTIPEEPENR